MNEDQKAILGWLGIAVLLAAAAFTIALMVQLRNGSYLDAADPENVVLSSLWQSAATIMKLGAAGKIAFATVLTVITAGIAVVARTYRSKWQISVLVVVCAAGIIAALMLVGAAGPDASITNDIRYYGDFGQTNEDVSDRVSSFCYGLISWFGAYAATILGISSLKEGGTLANLIQRLRG